MQNPFNRERWGRPQLFAILLLLAFLGQALYICAQQPLRGAELGYIQTGEQRLRGAEIESPHFVSPLIALTAAVPVIAVGRTSLTQNDEEFNALRWPARLPFLVIGLLLGGSIWYVARRLYGNAGGYVALALYCFSTAPVASAGVGPNIVAMFGVFGIIYIAIALAHTFYPMPGISFAQECRPRWRRVLLLAAATVLALGAAPTTMLILPIALAFMLYVAPARRWLALVVLVVTTTIAVVVLWALNGFSGAALAQQLSLSFTVASWAFAKSRLGYYAESVLWLTHYPALLLLLVGSLVAWVVSRRIRYFGNTAPLLVLVLLWILAVAGLAPDILAYGAFPMRALPFVFIFMAGVAADLLETKARYILVPMVAALLLSHAVIGMRDLLRTGGSAHPFHVEDTQH